MKTKKTPIYFVPGLAASSKIFEYLTLSEDKFEFHFLEWMLPLTKTETIESYSKRMAALVTKESPVLVGVSFGGIMVQEMSKHLKVQKIILISSIKCRNEIPKRLRLIQITRLYKLFPAKYINNIESYSMYAFGEFAKKRVKLYKEYLSIRDEKYLTWAVKNILNWSQITPLNNILHIQGEEDHIFPIKHIKNCVPIKNGTHIMILNKAKTISKLIKESQS